MWEGSPVIQWKKPINIFLQIFDDTSFRQIPCLQESIQGYNLKTDFGLVSKKHFSSKTISFQVLDNLAAEKLLEKSMACMTIKTISEITSRGWTGAEKKICVFQWLEHNLAVSPFLDRDVTIRWGCDQISVVGWIRAGGQGHVDRWESACDQSIQHLQCSSRPLRFNEFLQSFTVQTKCSAERACSLLQKQ